LIAGEITGVGASEKSRLAGRGGTSLEIERCKFMLKEPKSFTAPEARQAEPEPSDAMLLVIGLGLAPLILGGVWVLLFHP
jgi:hypothetical protein